jgi:hypothetical protein
MRTAPVSFLHAIEGVMLPVLELDPVLACCSPARVLVPSCRPRGRWQADFASAFAPVLSFGTGLHPVPSADEPTAE